MNIQENSQQMPEVALPAVLIFISVGRQTENICLLFKRWYSIVS